MLSPPKNFRFWCHWINLSVNTPVLV